MPGMKFGRTTTDSAWGPSISSRSASRCVFGTAGLPHILIRFYTVPDAKTARSSVVWAMVLIGIFYIMTTFFGFGAAAILGPAHIIVDGKPNDNMAAPLLARALGGEIFFAFISAVAFATILAVVAGLDDQREHLLRARFLYQCHPPRRESRPGEEVLVARITAFVVGAVSIWLAIALGRPPMSPSSSASPSPSPPARICR